MSTYYQPVQAYQGNYWQPSYWYPSSEPYSPEGTSVQSMASSPTTSATVMDRNCVNPMLYQPTQISSRFCSSLESSSFSPNNRIISPNHQTNSPNHRIFLENSGDLRRKSADELSGFPVLTRLLAGQQPGPAVRSKTSTSSLSSIETIHVAPTRLRRRASADDVNIKQKKRKYVSKKRGSSNGCHRKYIVPWQRHTESPKVRTPLGPPLLTSLNMVHLHNFVSRLSLNNRKPNTDNLDIDSIQPSIIDSIQPSMNQPLIHSQTPLPYVVIEDIGNTDNHTFDYLLNSEWL